MRPQIRSITWALALLIALGVHQGKAFTQGAPTKKAAAEAEPQETLWLEFKGGTLADYAAAVKNAAGGDLNVVVDGQAESVEMPPVTLKNVTVGTAFKLIQSSVVGDVARAAVETIREGRGGKDVYVLRVFPVPGKKIHASLPQAPNQEPKRLQVFPLKRLLQDSGQEATAEATGAVLKAIDVALGLDDPDAKEKPVVKYHAESGLMMVRATEEQLSVVSQIFTNLVFDTAGGSSVKLNPDPPLAKEIQDLKDEVDKLKAEIAKLKAALVKIEEKQETKP